MNPQRMLIRFAMVPAALLVLGGTVAVAQTAAQPANPQTSNCTPDTRQGSRGSGADDSTVGSGSNLSDKLASSNGVICPPAGVDPDMHKPAPGGGRMLVIPPPGGPGGDQNTIPK